MTGALSHLRICDFTGQLAGAGATRFLAAFGAQVIRIEDPVNQGRWDILRGMPPYVDERRGVEFGGPFNNHNVEKLGVTLNLRTERGKELLRELVAVSDVVAENFSAGVMERLGFEYEALKALREDIIYVSNCGFGHRGPYRDYKTWGPIVQAVSGLTFSSGLPDQPPAGWGYSYMDHTGGYYMAIAILMALRHRNQTGEGAVGGPGLHRGRGEPDGASNARLHGERASAATAGEPEQQSRPAPLDGPARHLSLAGGRHVDRDRVPRRPRLGGVRRGYGGGVDTGGALLGPAGAAGGGGRAGRTGGRVDAEAGELRGGGAPAGGGSPGDGGAASAGNASTRIRTRRRGAYGRR